jgi:hypothetical protein
MVAMPVYTLFDGRRQLIVLRRCGLEVVHRLQALFDGPTHDTIDATLLDSVEHADGTHRRTTTCSSLQVP